MVSLIFHLGFIILFAKIIELGQLENRDNSSKSLNIENELWKIVLLIVFEFLTPFL